MTAGYQGGPPEYNFSFPGNLDEIIERGTSFVLKKHDVSTTVGIIEAGDFGLSRSLLVKRFNYRGLFDFLIHRIFIGRAKRLWDTNMELYRKGLPVPEPITYVESSLKKKNAFFVSSVISDADSLSALYRKGNLSGNRELGRRLAETISGWHLSGAVHGDLKWPNILIQNNAGTYRCFFIDLDQARIYSRPCIKGISGDIERFYRFALQLGAEQWVETEFLPEYVSFFPVAMRNNMDLTGIKNKALKEWTKKGRKRL
jgi:tRNA A-37 threonylcarbamoyl transferase component Bud32